MDDDAIEGLAADLAAADHPVVFTGAGASTASGIPDFRSEGGIWDRFDQRDFHYQRFLAEPGAFWEDRLDLQAELYGDDTIEPNAAHEAIADLERRGHVEAVITQNVDGLHAEAGSAWSPSTFCVITASTWPRRSRSAMASWAAFGSMVSSP